MSKIDNIFKTQLETIKSLIIDENQEPIMLNGKKTFGKYVNNIGAYIYQVNLIPITLDKITYNFVELRGVDALEEQKDEPKTHITRYYLLNKDQPIFGTDESKMLKIEQESDDYYVNYIKNRLPGVKESLIYFYNYVFEKENRDKATCIELTKFINKEKNEVDVANIGSTINCNLPQNKKIAGLTGIFLLIFSLLKKVKFDGILTIGDMAKKDGKRVAFYYMKKHNEPEYLLKNSDYIIY